tara:strand:- start:1444 stop:1971 length:528 start_codon:yes stop_codon:yes gene_type:complete
MDEEKDDKTTEKFEVILKKQLKKDIKSLDQKCNDLENDMPELSSELELIKSYIEYLKKVEIESPDTILKTIPIAGNIESELDNIDDSIVMSLHSKSQANVSKQGSSSINKLSPVRSTLKIMKGLVKKITNRLWQYLGQYMKLQEWSLSGSSNINMGGLFGGVVKLQLNFGPTQKK